MGENVSRQVAEYNRSTNLAAGEGYTVGSLRDSKGRCTLTLRHEPFDDPLYGCIDAPEAVVWLLDRAWGVPGSGYITRGFAPGGLLRHARPPEPLGRLRGRPQRDAHLRGSNKTSGWRRG